jgi:transposase
MNIHKNARLTLKIREHLARQVVEQGMSPRQAAIRFQVSGKTAGKWVARYRIHGFDGLRVTCSISTSRSWADSTPWAIVSTVT